MLNFAYLTSFQKNYIGWPQQPPTEKVLKFNMSFHDFVKNIFFKTSKESDISPQIINLEDSEVLCSDFPGLRNLSSLIDLSSLCNLTGLNSL